MSIQTIIRPFIAALTLAGSALAAPVPKALPMVKQAGSIVRYCEEGVPAPGYRDIHLRFGTHSHTDTRSVPAR